MNIGVKAEQKVDLVNKMRIHNGGAYTENPEGPILFSNVTNWRPKPFINLLDFLDKYVPEDPPKWEEEIIKAAKKNFVFSDFATLADARLERVNKFMDEMRNKFHTEWVRNRMKTRLDDLCIKLRYPNAKTINEKLVKEGNYDKVYVLPIFMQPGKVDFLIRSRYDPQILKKIERKGRDQIRLLPYQRPEDCEFKFYYERHMIEIREDPIPFCKLVVLTSPSNPFYLQSPRNSKLIKPVSTS